MSYQLSELAKQTGSRLEGEDCLIESIAEISSAGSGDIAFVSNPKYLEHLSTTGASALIIKPDFLEECSVPALVTDNPRLVYAKVANLLYPARTSGQGINASAVVADTANIDASAYVAVGAVIADGVTIGAGSQIGANCVIDEDVVIGSNTRISANASIGYGSKIGNNCIIHSEIGRAHV